MSSVGSNSNPNPYINTAGVNSLLETKAKTAKPEVSKTPEEKAPATVPVKDSATDLKKIGEDDGNKANAFKFQVGAKPKLTETKKDTEVIQKKSSTPDTGFIINNSVIDNLIETKKTSEASQKKGTTQKQELLQVNFLKLKNLLTLNQKAERLKQGLL